MHKNITILFYINSIRHGGAERVISELANNFAEHGYSVILLTSFKDDNEYVLSKKVVRASIEQQEQKRSRIKKNYFRIKTLRKICKNNKIDVAISFMAEPNFRSVIATLGLHTRTIISVRNDPNKEYVGFLGKIIGKIILPLADGCIFQTEEAKKWFPKKLQKKSKIIFNQVDKDFFNSRWKRGQTIVALGRLTEQKNHLLLIKAFSQITEEFDEIRLEIYGEGELKEHLQTEIDKLDCRNKIILKGLTDNPIEALETCALFVLPSNYEGMPNVLLEAMAVGVPCISTDCPCGGPKMIIKSGWNGILIPVNDIQSLSDSIRKILQNKEYASNLANTAKESAKRYNPQIIFKEWEQYILNIVDAND